MESDTSGMPTEEASHMAEIVGTVAPAFKEREFRKQRHAFNRSASDTVTHAVDFQMGPFDPPGTVEIPGLRPNLYGLFTVNLGVFSMTMNLVGHRAGSWINEPICQLRLRLGQLATGHETDLWWRLDAPVEAADDVLQSLTEHGFPWLDGLSTDEAILDNYSRLGRTKLGMSPRAPLDIAALQLELGQRDAAIETARNYLQEDMSPGHRPVAEETVRSLDLSEAFAEDS